MAYYKSYQDFLGWHANNCASCVHELDCKIQVLHVGWNSEQHAEPIKREALETLLPTSENVNMKCTMHHRALWWPKHD